MVPQESVNTQINDLDEDAFTELYGAWAGRTPADAAALMQGYPGVWWVAGGWAVEAFTGVRRHHEDMDIVVLRADLPALRRHLADRLHAWTATAGALCPLLPHNDPEGSADEVLPAGCGQLWTRRGAAHPWEFDILLDPGTEHEWVYKRDRSITMPLNSALWQRDGVAYLAPEIQLLLKAQGDRPKDRADLAATLPLLDPARRDWLRAALHTTLPGHPWLATIAAEAIAGRDYQA